MLRQMDAETRSQRFEVWSRADDGSVEKHGEAFGVTFEDACKQLACESIDFWTHYDKGRYQGRLLCRSPDDALHGVEPEKARKSSRSSP